QQLKVISLIMANQQFGNGQSQSPMSTNVPDGRHPPPTPVNIKQTTALNLFLMGQGRANVQLGFPTPQGLMDYFGNVNEETMASQQPQQQQMPVEFATAAGNTVPLPANNTGRRPYKSGVKSGSPASDSKVGEAPGMRMTRMNRIHQTGSRHWAMEIQMVARAPQLLTKNCSQIPLNFILV
ncbi:hypothetical protein Ocin01_02595, partial [Orchesella cincta]